MGIKKKEIIILIILSILLLYTRFFYLPKSLYISSPVYNNEPLWHGTMAKDLIDGLKGSSFFEYQYTGYEGGSLLAGFLTVPFFIIFGDSFFSLSLVPILFALGTLIILYLFLLKYFGHIVAFIAGLLFVFTPRMFVFRQVCAYADHVEAIFFTFLMLYLFFEIFMADKRKKKTFLFASFGLVSGFAIYYFYNTVIAFVVCALFWIIVDRRTLVGRRFLVSIVCFFVGLSPWLLYNIRSGFSNGFNFPSYENSGNTISIFDVLHNNIIAQVTPSFKIFFAQFKDLFFLDYPYMLSGDLYYYMILAFLAIFLLINLKYLVTSVFRSRVVSQKCLREMFIASYISLYIVLWLLYPARIKPEHYLYPLYPFLFIAIGICVDKVLKYKNRLFNFIKYPLIIIFALCLILIGFSNFRSYALDENIKSIKDIFKVKGYSLEFTSRFYNTFSAIDSTWGRFYSIYNKIQYPNKYVIKDDYSAMDTLENKYHPYLYLMFGINIGDGIGRDLDSSINAQISKHIKNSFNRHYMYEGIALSITNRLFKDVMKIFRSGSVDLNIPNEYRHYFYTELGRRIGERYKGRAKDVEALINDFNERWRPYIYRGFIASLGDRESRSSIIDSLDSSYKGDFYRHLGILDAAANKNELENILEHCRAFYVQGLIVGFFRLSPSPFSETIKKAIVNFSYLKRYQAHVYEGLGIAIAGRTFGHLSNHDLFLEDLIPEGYTSDFYRGYNLGVALRYGEDRDEANRIISTNTNLHFNENIMQDRKE